MRDFLLGFYWGGWFIGFAVAYWQHFPDWSGAIGITSILGMFATALIYAHI